MRGCYMHTSRAISFVHLTHFCHAEYFHNLRVFDDEYRRWPSQCHLPAKHFGLRAARQLMPQISIVGLL